MTKKKKKSTQDLGSFCPFTIALQNHASPASCLHVPWGYFPSLFSISWLKQTPLGRSALSSARSRGRERDVRASALVGGDVALRAVLTSCAPPPHAAHDAASDADDQAGAVQRPRAARAELGALPAQVPPQEPHQAQGAQEEERQEGVHALPPLAARQQGVCANTVLDMLAPVCFISEDDNYRCKLYRELHLHVQDASFVCVDLHICMDRYRDISVCTAVLLLCQCWKYYHLFRWTCVDVDTDIFACCACMVSMCVCI